MKTKWCHNSKTGKIFSYNVDGDWTDFPRGSLLVYGDFLTTGLDSREEAEKWAKEWGACMTCKCSRPLGKKCGICGGEVIKQEL